MVVGSEVTLHVFSTRSCTVQCRAMRLALSGDMYLVSVVKFCLLPRSLSDKILQSGFLSPSLRASVTWLTNGKKDLLGTYCSNMWTVVTTSPFSRYDLRRGEPSNISLAK